MPIFNPSESISSFSAILKAESANIGQSSVSTTALKVVSENMDRLGLTITNTHNSNVSKILLANNHYFLLIHVLKLVGGMMMRTLMLISMGAIME
jgi:hypothetical protein